MSEAAKTGRGRQYSGYGDMSHELDHLQELRLRAQDLIEDLDETALVLENAGHSIQELYKHMIKAEVNWISKLGPQQTAVIPGNIERLEMFTRTACSRRDLHEVITLGSFVTLGDMLRHLQWHWTYHAGQIGLLRRAQDHNYKWTFES